MKWNDEIRDIASPINPIIKPIQYLGDLIYDKDKAQELFNRFKKYDHRKLSLMKQENIRMAIKEKLDLRTIKETIGELCGYCFKYRKPYPCLCTFCPLNKKLGKPCFSLPLYEKLKPYKTLKGFANGHKLWCKQLGLWKKEWE